MIAERFVLAVLVVAALWACALYLADRWGL